MADDRYERTTIRGLRFSRWMAAVIREAERRLGYELNLTQGSWSGAKTSAGTHAGDGAVDWYPRGGSWANLLRECQVFRDLGVAAYPREASKAWKRHGHGIQAHNPNVSRSAAAQLTDYARGLNALADKGPDPVPYRPELKPYPYGAAAVAAAPEEEDDMLVIARSTNDPQVWIGNGVTRRKIVSQDTLKSVQYLATNGLLRVAGDGAVQKIDDLWALGHPLDVDFELTKAAIHDASPETVASAVPDDIAEAVANLLSQRLKG